MRADGTNLYHFFEDVAHLLMSLYILPDFQEAVNKQGLQVGARGRRAGRAGQGRAGQAGWARPARARRPGAVRRKLGAAKGGSCSLTSAWAEPGAALRLARTCCTRAMGQALALEGRQRTSLAQAACFAQQLVCQG
jgi:hypothetical protein